MLKSLFKPKWQHTNPDIRLTALNKLSWDNAEDRETIKHLARNDRDEQVRHQAIGHVRDADVLKALLSSSPHSEDTPLIHQHWGTLISAPPSKSASPISTANLPEPVLTLALLNCRQIEQARSLLKQLENPQQKMKVALEHPLASIRLEAAETLQQTTLIRQLQKNSSDKNIKRLCKNHLQQASQAEAEKKASQASINLTLSALKAHSLRPLDALYRARLQGYQQQWMELSTHADAEQTKLARASLQQCQKQVDAQLEALAQLEAQATSQEECLATCSNLEQSLKDIENNPWSDATEPSLETLLSTQRTRWQEATRQIAPEGNTVKRFEQAYSALNSLQQAILTLNDTQNTAAVHDLTNLPMDQTRHLLKQSEVQIAAINWPASVPPCPAITRLQTNHNHLQEAMDKAIQQERLATRELKKLHGKLRHTLAEGRLRAANLTYQRINEIVATLSSSETRYWEQALTPMAEELNKLQDWAGFATEDKKEKLCQQMESLASNNLPPQDKLTEIKTLQQQWRQLSGFSIKNNGDPLWQRFQEAGDKAFEPCQKFFAAKDELKHYNLSRKQDLCDQLTHYIENTKWQQADWQQVTKVLQTVREQWSHYEPIDHKQSKTIAQEYKKLTGVLNDHLNEEKKSNLEFRRILVASARNLADMDDVAQAMEQAKALQKRWKTAGITFHKEGQSLWEEFRKACNTPFQRSTQQREANRAILAQEKGQATKIIHSISLLKQRSDDNIRETEKGFRELQEAFSTLENRNTDQYKSLVRAFEAACHDFTDHKQSLPLRKQLQELKHLRDLSSFCSKHENQPPDNPADLKNQWENIGGVNTMLNSRFNNLLIATEPPSNKTQDNNRTQLERLSIQLELLAETTTPEEYRSQRIAFQLEKLGKAQMGTLPKEQRIDEFMKLEVQWHQIGPTEAEHRSKLEQRRIAAASAILPGIG